MATASNRQRHERESLLEYISSRGSRYGSTWAERMSGSLAGAGSSSQSSTNPSKDAQKDHAELKELESAKKSQIDELNLSLEQLLAPCADLWEALSNSLRESFLF